jgi:hypothetical protein
VPGWKKEGINEVGIQDSRFKNSKFKNADKVGGICDEQQRGCQMSKGPVARIRFYRKEQRGEIFAHQYAHAA